MFSIFIEFSLSQARICHGFQSTAWAVPFMSPCFGRVAIVSRSSSSLIMKQPLPFFQQISFKLSKIKVYSTPIHHQRDAETPPTKSRYPSTQTTAKTSQIRFNLPREALGGII